MCLGLVYEWVLVWFWCGRVGLGSFGLGLGLFKGRFGAGLGGVRVGCGWSCPVYVARRSGLRGSWMAGSRVWKEAEDLKHLHPKLQGVEIANRSSSPSRWFGVVVRGLETPGACRAYKRNHP